MNQLPQKILRPLLGLLALVSLSSASADPSTASAKEESGTSLSIATSSTGKISLSGGGIRGKASTRATALGLQQALGGSDHVSFSAGLSYDRVVIRQAEGAALPLPEKLSTLTAGVTAQWQAAPAWQVTGIAATVWSSGANRRGFGTSLGSASRGFVVVGMVAHPFSETFSASAGAAYNSKGEGVLKFGPVLSLEWKFAESWTASLGYPTTGISYQLSEQWKFGLEIEGLGGTYYVDQDPLPNQAGQPSLARTQLQFYDVRAGLSATYALKPGTILRLTFGEVLGQEFNYPQRQLKLKSDSHAVYGAVALQLGF